MTGLMVHAGARKVEAAQLATISTPAATETWFPIPHDNVYGLVRDNLTRMGYAVRKEEHGLSKDDARWFAVLTLAFEGAPADYSLVAGIRNSHDKTFPTGLIVGSRVFVCDNLAFSGEISIKRKHTRNIFTDLPRLVGDAMGKLGDMRQSQETRIAAYKDRQIGDSEAHDLLIRAMDVKVLPNRIVPDVLNEWRKPRHVDFMPRNAWSLFNAFTEVLKQTSPTELPNRTIGLHGLMDALCNLKQAQGAVLN